MFEFNTGEAALTPGAEGLFERDCAGNVVVWHHSLDMLHDKIHQHRLGKGEKVADACRNHRFDRSFGQNLFQDMGEVVEYHNG